MNEITPAECRELAERLGILHKSEGWKADISRYCCSCGEKFRTSEPLTFHLREMRPDFSNPLVVLREMRKRYDWIKFLLSLVPLEAHTTEEMISRMLDDILLGSPSPGEMCKLGKATLEWLRKEQGE